MNDIPGWWINASGAFFVLGTTAMLVILILLGVLINTALELSRTVKSLGDRVERIGERVENVSKQVQTITEVVNVRTQGLVRMVDDSADRAFNTVDKFGPAVLAAAIIVKVVKLFKSKS